MKIEHLELEELAKLFYAHLQAMMQFHDNNHKKATNMAELRINEIQTKIIQLGGSIREMPGEILPIDLVVFDKNKNPIPDTQNPLDLITIAEDIRNAVEK